MKRFELKQLIREVIVKEFAVDKMEDIDIIKGETIVSFTGEGNDSFMTINCESRHHYDIYVDDEGPSNDSHAFISEIDLKNLVGKPIVFAQHEGKNSYGVTLVMKAADGSEGHVTIDHEHNGYYGFSYSVIKRTH
jgi:hypothetical protein